MRVIIAGSRNISPKQIEDVFAWRMRCVEQAVKDSGFNIDLVVSGGADGIDLVGEAWADKNKIPYKRFPANWKQHGRGAGVIRNAEMARHADGLIAVWDGMSPGTRNMIETASRKGLKIHIFQPTT